MRRHTAVAAPVFYAVAVLLWTCHAGHTAGVSQLTYYVSTAGSDAWSGKLAAPNVARTDGPFATFERARDAVRMARAALGTAPGTAAQAAGGAKIVVRGGMYRFEDALLLDQRDSGTLEQPMRYVAYSGESPIITGGVAVNDWKPYKGNILQADLSRLNLKFRGAGTPWTGWGAGKWVRDPITQVFFRNQRMVLARYPNLDPKAPWGKGFLYIDSLPKPDSADRFRLKPSDLRAWGDVSDAEVFFFSGYCYISECSKVKSIDRQTGEVVLADPSWCAFRPGNRLYFQNLLEELDAPGEWYWDKAKNVLYFYPPTDGASKSLGATPKPGEVIVPTAGSALSIKGASNLLFEGFTIQAFNNEAVSISGGDHTVLARCTVRNIGGHGVSVGDGSDNGVEGCDIHDIGSTAINLSGGDRKTLTPSRNFADNNHIYHMGVLRKGDSAISISGCGNRVSHNTIHDIPRIGVIFGGNDNIVEYNHIHHCNLEIEDTGAIYLGGVSWTIRGNVIRYNRIHDTGGYGGAGNTWHYPYFCWGIYLDDWASGAQVYGNLVYRTYYAGIHNHSGRDNTYENNILVDGKLAQILYSAWPTTHSALPKMFDEIKAMGWPKGRYPGLDRMKDPIKDAVQSYNVFQRNIVSYSDASSLLYMCYDLVYKDHTSDYNLIYSHGNPIQISLPGVPKDQQWAKWKETGFEQHSVVADPQFVDPTHDDYRLKPTSPALKLGFQPLPISQMGCRPGPRRATWPLQSPEDSLAPVGVYHPELEGSAGLASARGAGVSPAVVPRYIVHLATSPIRINGGLIPLSDWQLDKTKAMVIARAPGSERASKYKAWAWAVRDAKNLYLTVWVDVDLGKPLVAQGPWGGKDAVEFAFRDPSNPNAPIYNLRGDAGGAQDSVCDAGASAAQARKLLDAMSFASEGDGDHWIGQWRIPFAAAGIDPAKLKKLQFNINVRRMADESWMVWTDTGAQIWQVGTAGELVFQR